ncbi:MAG: hypothetical protein H0X51_07375 [Parachlamydiaceae bacterium]|nr:hypothetical protein [Parachlamydiaceae bacterium]
MSADLIQLPNVSDIREMLTSARQDINAEIKTTPELADQSKLLFQVLDIVEEKTNKTKDFNALSGKEKIEMAAYLNFLHVLLEDFFSIDDFEGFEEVEDDEDDEK